MKKTAVVMLALVLACAAASAAVAAPRISSIVRVSASANALKFTRAILHAKAGRIEIVFTNPSMMRHNVRLEQGEHEFGGTATIAHGVTKAFVTLRAGRYHFYCSLPGHEAAGMSGTLVVA